MTKILFATAVMFVVLAASPRSAEAVPIIDAVDGKLNGATDILVNGVYYDVSFVDGAFLSVFNGGADLTFTTSADANVASRALLDFVLVGDYDTDPTLVRGISALYYSRSYIVTPYELLASTSIRAVAAVNSIYVMDAVDSVYGAGNIDYSANPTCVWAVWEESGAPVPEPSTILLLGGGIAAVVWYGRKRKRA